jgi:hypothetical protein
MKKTLILTMAIATIFSFGIVGAMDVTVPMNLDTVKRTYSSSPKRILQKNYLESLRQRYQNMYNRKRMDRDYRNLYNQKVAIKRSQKAAHVVGGIKSILSRTGEMEQDKERVKENTPYQVQAVNHKSVFLKRAMDYYVYGGEAGSDVMSVGNINMKNHKIDKRRMLNKMYAHKKRTRRTLSETRDLQKAMMDAPKYETSEKRPVNYRTGDFRNNMLSPFTSLKWMD